MSEDEKAWMLAPYRILDLTDEKGYYCGKLLGDLGADVIKIEKPAGDPGRNIGPFYHDIPDSEKSLFWFAYNANKRGITLDIETSDGKEIFKRLIKTADVVVESFSPGYMDSLGLGYTALSGLNPRLVMASITPFGQKGPYKDYKGPDIIPLAMGGGMFTHGDPDRPPVRISFPQAFLLASAQAAAGAMIALFYCGVSGEGQHVDVSAQHWLLIHQVQGASFWEMYGEILGRTGHFRTGLSGAVSQQQIWPCKDGFCVFLILGGPIGKRSNPVLAGLVKSEGFTNEVFEKFDWDNMDMSKITPEMMNKLAEPIGKFFLVHTKAELLELAVNKGIVLSPVCVPKDILENAQLRFRDFWIQLEHPELGDSITYPGAFTKFTEAHCGVWRRAPLISEHNQEVYGEVGLSTEELVILKQGKVI